MEYKGYMLEGLGTFSMYKIKAKGQGKVPSLLDGVFTTKSEASKAVDIYLESLKKGKGNGKTKGTASG